MLLFTTCQRLKGRDGGYNINMLHFVPRSSPYSQFIIPSNHISCIYPDPHGALHLLTFLVPLRSKIRIERRKCSTPCSVHLLTWDTQWDTQSRLSTAKCNKAGKAEEEKVIPLFGWEYDNIFLRGWSLSHSLRM